MAPPNFKKKFYRDEKYMQFTREQICIITGTTPCDPHHVFTGGKAIKNTDLAIIPLNRFVHGEIDTLGKKTFAEKHDIDFTKQALINLMKYVCHLNGDNPDDYDWTL